METSTFSVDAQFLNSSLHWHTSVFQKQDNPSFAKKTITKYPHHSTFLPTKSLYNIVYNEAIRYHHICSRKSAFLLKLAKLLLILTKIKSYPLSPLLCKIDAFFKMRTLHRSRNVYAITTHLSLRRQVLTTLRGLKHDYHSGRLRLNNR
jgi:hypothetical protein